MSKKERNKHLRELASEIASTVAKKLNFPYKKLICHRISKRRGYGYKDGVFSVPFWATRDTDYFIYYCVHEACHVKYQDHGPSFRNLEKHALKIFGIRIAEYRNGGPYPARLVIGNKVIDVSEVKK